MRARLNRFVTVAVLCLFLCSPVRAAENVGDDCYSLGATTIAADRTNIIACMLKKAASAPDATCEKSGGCLWKSMTGGANTVPVGGIIAWPAASNPADMENWLECNGQTIKRDAYPKLYDLIGSSVPDYRGMFLRGLGSKSVAQINGTTKGPTTTVHSSAALGETQGDSIRDISGVTAVHTSQGSMYLEPNMNGAFTTTPFKYGSGYVIEQETGGWGIQFDASRVTPVSTEIRPVNMAVRYFIRAKP